MSIAALSYWQSGKRQPERNDSLLALRELEKILNTPPGTLRALLPAPRPRGKQAAGHPAPQSNMDRFQAEALESLISRLGWPDALEQARQLVLIGLHDRCDVAEDGGQRTIATRAVLQSTANGLDRWLLVYTSEASVAPPMPHTIRNCRVGARQVDSDHGMVAAELIFDRPLRRDETYLIEYELRHQGPPYPDSGKTHWREFRRPVKEYLLEVHFTNTHTAPRCRQFAQESGASEPRMRDLVLDTAHGVHAVAIDFGPGAFGIKWG